MTKAEAKKLKIGARVKFAPDGALGTVIERGYNAIKIAWDDGQFAVNLFAENSDVSLAPDKEG